MRLPNLLHVCIHSLLKRPAVQRASKVIRSHILLACTLFVVLWKRVAVTFVEVSLVLGFLLLANANTADRTLCKYL